MTRETEAGAVVVEGERSSASFAASPKHSNEIVIRDVIGTEERVFVSCYFHGTSLAEPRHEDTHHGPECPEGPHCAYCWHGWPLTSRCNCVRVEGEAA